MTKLFVKTHHVMCVCMKKCSYNSASIVLLLERSSSKDRPQLENNKNFSQLLSWWRKTFGPWSTNLMSAATVVATNLGQRTMLLLLLGQTRLWWLHLTKLAWDSTVPWEPQKCCCPCLFVLLFLAFTYTPLAIAVRASSVVPKSCHLSIWNLPTCSNPADLLGRRA